MSNLINASLESNHSLDNTFASCVFPTPVDPKKMNDPIGLLGSFKPILLRCIALTIFATYIFVYYEALDKFTYTLQYTVIVISILGFIASLYILVTKAKELFSKDYRYTTIILILISLLAMWYNQYLFIRI